jgi:hypothetical protein
VDHLSLSLSSSKGERVPFRAGEGPTADSPGFYGSGCLRLPTPNLRGGGDRADLFRAVVRAFDLLEGSDEQARIGSGHAPHLTL